jgi:hypothetical protein
MADFPGAVASFAFTPAAGKGVPYDDYLKVHDEIIAVETELLAAFTAVAFNAANFTAGGTQTWTVQSGDQTTYAYKKTGKFFRLMVELLGTTIGGTPDPVLRIAVPGGFTIAKTTRALIMIRNNAGAFTTGILRAGDGDTYLGVYRDLTATANWANGTDNNDVLGQIFFETTT